EGPPPRHSETPPAKAPAGPKESEGLQPKSRLPLHCSPISGAARGGRASHARSQFTAPLGASILSIGATRKSPDHGRTAASLRAAHDSIFRQRVDGGPPGSLSIAKARLSSREAIRHCRNAAGPMRAKGGRTTWPAHGYRAW